MGHTFRVQPAHASALRLTAPLGLAKGIRYEPNAVLPFVVASHQSSFAGWRSNDFFRSVIS